MWPLVVSEGPLIPEASSTLQAHGGFLTWLCPLVSEEGWPLAKALPALAVNAGLLP